MIDFNELTQPGTFPDPEEPLEWKCRLAGVTFENRQEAIAKYAMNNSKYRLIRQPDNKFDKNFFLLNTPKLCKIFCCTPKLEEIF